MLVGYNKDEQEIGMMPIEFMISASDESYIWGPNFGAKIFANFEDWPWWFKIEADVPDTDIWDASGYRYLGRFRLFLGPMGLQLVVQNRDLKIPRYIILSRDLFFNYPINFTIFIFAFY